MFGLCIVIQRSKVMCGVGGRPDCDGISKARVEVCVLIEFVSGAVVTYTLCQKRARTQGRQ